MQFWNAEQTPGASRNVSNSLKTFATDPLLPLKVVFSCETSFKSSLLVMFGVQITYVNMVKSKLLFYAVLTPLQRPGAFHNSSKTLLHYPGYFELAPPPNVFVSAIFEIAPAKFRGI